MTASDGARLYVEEQGRPDAGLTLVFVHGFCMTADAWAFQRRDLADLGRTLCYDQRAHGRSGPSDAEHCTIRQLADDLRHVPSLLERLRWRGSAVSRQLTRRIGFGAGPVPEPVVDALETMVTSTPIPVVGAFLPTLLDHDRLAAAAALRAVPTLLLVGDADLMTPIEHSRVLAEALPEAELAVERGAGHALILERPRAVSARLRDLVNRAVPSQPARTGRCQHSTKPENSVPSPRR